MNSRNEKSKARWPAPARYREVIAANGYAADCTNTRSTARDRREGSPVSPSYTGQVLMPVALNELLAAEAEDVMKVRAIAEVRMKVMRRMATSLSVRGCRPGLGAK